MIQLKISLFQLQEPDSSIQATLEQGSWIGKNNVGQDRCHIEGYKWVGWDWDGNLWVGLIQIAQIVN